jgi:phosphoribosylamine--glycine ligase
MARALAFDAVEDAIEYARDLARDGHGLVVKADGLAAGKGVTVCDDAETAALAIRDVLATPGARVVIEERLRGPEASLIALCDGRDALGLPLARDHKRLGDADTGPNTGGMGAVSPLPDLPDGAIAGLLATFHRPILAELARRGTPFRGALYAGLILTADGPVLLECNARFGDPETQALMPRLAVALGPLLLAAARGDLASASRALGIHDARVPVLPGATVAVVLAAAGYPDAPRKGDLIEGLDRARGLGSLVFHAGSFVGFDGTARTAGGRVLAIVGRGADIAAARGAAESAADGVSFDGLQRRRDIGLSTIGEGSVLTGAAS